MKLKIKLNAFVKAAPLLILALLTGCVCVSPAGKDSLKLLQQPPVLRIQKGTQVKTLDGEYIPATDETWHSDLRYRQLEQAYLDALSANSALKLK